MDSYPDRTQNEVISTVAAQIGDPGTADVWMSLKTKAHEVELVSRVSREDLPKLVQDLYNCVAPELRATLLDCLKDLG